MGCFDALIAYGWFIIWSCMRSCCCDEVELTEEDLRIMSLLISPACMP